MVKESEILKKYERYDNIMSTFCFHEERSNFVAITRAKFISEDSRRKFKKYVVLVLMQSYLIINYFQHDGSYNNRNRKIIHYGTEIDSWSVSPGVIKLNPKYFHHLAHTIQWYGRFILEDTHDFAIQFDDLVRKTKKAQHDEKIQELQNEINAEIKEAGKLDE